MRNTILPLSMASILAAFAGAQTTPAPAPAPSPSPAKAPEAPKPPENVRVLADISEAAKSVLPFMTTDAGRDFVRAADSLPPREIRTVYRDRERGLAISEDEWKKLAADEQAKFKPRAMDERMYYYTGYGTPLTYARMLDLLGTHGVTSWKGKRVFDFGNAAIGHLRMLASLGADAQGVDVEPLWAAMYTQLGDQGKVPAAAIAAGAEGNVNVHVGRWPAEKKVADAIGGGYDIFLSKNTLKYGYIHPKRETEKRFTIDLGVDDAAFLKAVYDALKPGGLAIIYNICPAQAPADKPYIPWADGEFPFAKDLTEKAGFEILAWDIVDDEVCHKLWPFVSGDTKSTPEELKTTIFTHYTVLRKRAS
ncbi:MAG: hypothetical protein K2Y21_06460 [Phycisphaerales bacterium]|nr:hypothetical protein [Phycisphaerales bacterium]